MSLGNLFGGADKETIAKDKLIEITKRTVRFGASVFQWENVTGFRLAKVKKKIVFPIRIITFFLSLGLLLLLISAAINSQPVKTWGIICCLVSVAGIVLNAIQPKRHGLEISLNSSERIMFVTEDLKGVRDIVVRLYEFMESVRDSAFTVNIDQREARIHNIDQSQSNIGVGSADTVHAQSIGGTVHEVKAPNANQQNQNRH